MMQKAKRVSLPSYEPPLWLKLRIWAGSIIHYGRSVGGGRGQVFRLPFRRIVKLDCHPNELEAMEFVRKHTTIPVPRVCEIYDYDEGQHLVMEEAQGGDIKVCYGGMTPDQVSNFGRELAGHLSQLRSLQPPAPGFIGSLSLGSSLDHRLSGTRFGPFHSVADFHTYLRRGRPLAHWENEPDVIRVHSRPGIYDVKFSHADLNPNNILVKDGHITAIVDWEFAGWYPEYWDYTKMYWSERSIWANFYRAVEGEPGIMKYPDERAAELAIWKRMHPWSYDDPPWSPGDDDQQPAQVPTDQHTDEN
ncbi:Uncharacterized protein TPAR_02789 [Tolypocladium paradoxum]|uniref:Aminoglycoside phosphotransferase domain-containing protein n=1 Tax=Tolypocladium paradoxum TaxID=94208 RepID=A0A2S4L3J6_9HYPO|nr:Uncharacterized protein TPAR_02789 [Tolypocladium paradoxum]